MGRFPEAAVDAQRAAPTLSLAFIVGDCRKRFLPVAENGKYFPAKKAHIRLASGMPAGLGGGGCGWC